MDLLVKINILVIALMVITGMLIGKVAPATVVIFLTLIFGIMMFSLP